MEVTLWDYIPLRIVLFIKDVLILVLVEVTLWDRPEEGDLLNLPAVLILVLVEVTLWDSRIRIFQTEID